MERIRVIAPADQPPVQYRNERGEYVQDRFIGRGPAPAHAPLPEGEEVFATVEVLRDIRRGHLVEAKDVLAAAADADPDVTARHATARKGAR